MKPTAWLGADVVSNEPLLVLDGAPRLHVCGPWVPLYTPLEIWKEYSIPRGLDSPGPDERQKMGINESQINGVFTVKDGEWQVRVGGKVLPTTWNSYGAAAAGYETELLRMSKIAYQGAPK